MILVVAAPVHERAPATDGIGAGLQVNLVDGVGPDAELGLKAHHPLHRQRAKQPHQQHARDVDRTHREHHQNDSYKPRNGEGPQVTSV